MILSNLAGHARLTMVKLFTCAMILGLHIIAAPAGAAEIVYVSVKAEPTIIDNSSADTYDPQVGPYRAGNHGPAPQFRHHDLDYRVHLPKNLGPKYVEVKVSGEGTSVLRTDVHCDKFLIDTHRVIMIRGDITILAEQEFKIANYAKVLLEEGATLTVYTKKVFTVQDHAVVNDDTTRPHAVKVVHLAPTDNLILQNHAVMAARVSVPHAQIQIQDGSHYYGMFDGHSVYLKNEGRGHFVGADPENGKVYD